MNISPGHKAFRAKHGGDSTQPYIQEVGLTDSGPAPGRPVGAVMEAPMRSQSGPLAEADEIRAYILGMVTALAEMAEQIHDTKLADNLRLVAWPGEHRAPLSRRR